MTPNALPFPSTPDQRRDARMARVALVVERSRTHTLADIGRDLGISRQRVQQLLAAGGTDRRREKLVSQAQKPVVAACARALRGWLSDSQDTLGQRLGWPKKRWSRIEQGRHAAHVTHVQDILRLADATCPHLAAAFQEALHDATPDPRLVLQHLGDA